MKGEEKEASYGTVTKRRPRREAQSVLSIAGGGLNRKKGRGNLNNNVGVSKL